EFELNRESEITSAVEDFAWFSDEPGADAGALPVWFLSKMSRQHVTVALSGEGGDELFGGYMTYRADELARPLRHVPRLLRRAVLGAARTVLPVSNAKIGFEYKLKRWLEGSLLDPDEAHLFWNGACSLEQKRALVPCSNGHHPAQFYKDLPGADQVGFLNRFLLLDQKYYLQDNLLYKVDRMSMAHSLEVRPPFLDHRIVEFAARLPERLKIRGTEQKIILRKILRGKLPDRILDRRKAGLDIPAHEWFRGPLLPLLQDTLTPDAVRATSLFSPEAVHALIDSHRTRKTNAGYQLWGLMTLFQWLKRWNIEVTPSAEAEHAAFAVAL
ncbi:MAG TPA: asparagine synthase C-terminal domain-containing protein, partial [Bryobacteraceae bacterium]|nr:asparagine synthase C-terminal domain-containing protein [Bryobacteraceae bacterium]